MAEYLWDESLETGDPLVDDQHRAIYKLVGDAESCRDKPGELIGVLERLMDYTSCHFATEEDLMARSGYTGEEAEAHVAQHRELTEMARDVVLQFRRGELTSVEPVAEFLRDWLREHVNERDRKFIEYVRSTGEAVAAVPEPWASNPLSRLGGSTDGSAA